MDIDFTQKLEDDLDNVANGTLEWTTLMNNFYTVCHKTVDTLMNHKIENMDKTTIEVLYSEYYFVSLCRIIKDE